jgi:hypothetical protein
VLSQTLYALRRDLGGEILVTGDTVALDLLQLSWDVECFRKELREGDLESAVRGYRGPFLDGVSFPDCDELDAWIAPLRSSLPAEYASAMGRLSERAASANRLTEAPTRLNQQRAGSKLVGRTAALVVAFAGVIVTAALSWQSITASRQDENAGLFDELDRERLRLFRERERSSRGRIFIETAINRSGHPFLDSIGRQLTSVLANVVDNSRIAHVVPRDSVKMIESDVAKLDGRRRTSASNAPQRSST